MSSAGGSRSRPQARRRPNDDAPYFGPPSSSGVKRQAADKADGADSRLKRKKIEENGIAKAVPVSKSNNHGGSRTKGVSSINRDSNLSNVDMDGRTSLVDFSKISLTETYRYLATFQLTPDVFPSPLSKDDPPAPDTLTSPANYGNANSQMRFPSHSSTPDPTVGGSSANSRLRSSRNSMSRRKDDDDEPSRQPILADVSELHAVLSDMAQHHFRFEMGTMSIGRELEVLAGFMCAVEKTRSAP